MKTALFESANGRREVVTCCFSLFGLKETAFAQVYPQKNPLDDSDPVVHYHYCISNSYGVFHSNPSLPLFMDRPNRTNPLQ